MIRLSVFLLLFYSCLFSRENPFAPVPNVEVNDRATNVLEERKDFLKKSTQLPSNARILKYVIFGYQALDGSIQTKRVQIDEAIDWHDPLFLTKESFWFEKYTQSSDLLPIPPASSNLTKVADEQKSKEIVKFKNLISFEIDKKSLFVRTDDKNIRHFMVIKPYKIVLDFKKEVAFYTKKIELKQAPFEFVVMGNHSDFYRAAIRLDGPYKYSVEQKDDGVLIILK